jgi:Mg/Co/Ni transporter MgtE
MDSARELSIGFLRSHPEGAAPVLEAIAPQDAAAFLKDVPDDVAGQAFESMQPLVAAAILPVLTRKKAAAALLTMDIHERSRIMRLLDDDLMKSIMDQMPKGAARDVARFLQYPEGSVGAWMSSDVAVFEKTATVGECLVQLRALPYKIRNLVFVVDAEKKLCGAVDLAKLLAAADDASIENLANAGLRRISPYAQLTSVVALAAWDTALSLPVVDSKKRLLGALHFDRLREGLASQQQAGSDRHIGQIMVHMAEAFLVCAAGVLHAPSAKPDLSRPIGEMED